MVLSSGLATFLIILAAPAITGLIIFLYLRFAKNTPPLLDKLVVGFAFLAGLIFWGKAGGYCISISVITKSNVSHYTALWPCRYVASDNHEYEIEYDTYGHCIINATDEDFVADYVQYGMGMDFGYVTLIPAHGIYHSTGTPDYLPWETPPDHVMSSINMSSKLWIRRPEPGDEYTHE